MDDAPSWGIEPVPERLRVLGLLDTTLLWVNLGISLLKYIRQMYAAGGKSAIDTLAINPYAPTVAQVEQRLRAVRRIMNSAKD